MPARIATLNSPLHRKRRAYVLAKLQAEIIVIRSVNGRVGNEKDKGNITCCPQQEAMLYATTVYAFSGANSILN
jgi:hypothetical protein